MLLSAFTTAAAAVTDRPGPCSSLPSFGGGRPGEEREISRGDADQGLLDGQVRGDAGAVETGHRKAAGRADGGAARGGRLPGGQRQLRRGGGVLPEAHRTRPPVRRPPEGLGVPAAHRSAVGIRLPGRDDDGHVVRRQAQQQAGELQGQAVQRGRAGAVARIGPPRSAATRPTPGGCTTCTATPSSGAATGTTRSCRAAPTPTCTPRRPRPRRSEHGDVSRVRRGGCWADDGWPCRSAFRLRFEPERRYRTANHFSLAPQGNRGG